MTCRYMYQNNRPMEPEECVQAFRTFKKDYWEGTKHFSTGDFYNLYDLLEDSLEIDTLTTIAYREIVSMPDYEKENVLSPYVCNLMAIQQMKRGTPNVEILKPFIDFKRRGKVGAGYGINVDQYVAGRGNIKFNRQQIVANQAACYYMEQKVDTALFLIEWLKDCKVEDEGTEQLENLINLKKLHFKARRTAKEEADYQRAKSAVLAMSDENKAILYTEIEEWGQRDQAMQWINKMDDNNPRKWYLKGILSAQHLYNNKSEEPLPSYGGDDGEGENDSQFYRWTSEKLSQYQADQWDDPIKAKALEEYNAKLLQYKKEHNNEEPPLAPETTVSKEKKNSTTVDADKLKGIPQYLGYFQHCFDLDPTKTYFRYYHNESHVNEDLRKTYKYKLKNRPLYREMFNLLKRRDAEKGDAGNSENPDASNEDADEEGKEETAA